MHGPGVGTTGLDGIAELVHRQGVAGHDVGPVGHDRHGGPGRVVGTRPEQAHRREVGGRLEAEALEQDGVGNEA